MPFRHGVAALLCALTLLVISPRVAGAVPSGRNRLVCGNGGWALIGQTWHIRTPGDFTRTGGTLFPPAIHQAKHLRAVQYWVVVDMNFQDTCRFTSTSSVEIGKNSHNGTYLLAISVTPLVPGTLSRQGPAVPAAHCAALRKTKYTGDILRPQQFARGIADYATIRIDLSSLRPTTAWQTIDGKVYSTVFAGVARAPGVRGLGAIEIIQSNSCAGRLGPTSFDYTPRPTGPLTLTAVHGPIVLFTFPHGHGGLSMRSRVFSLHGPRR